MDRCESLPSLRDSAFWRDSAPWIYIHGYALPSLRDWGQVAWLLVPLGCALFLVAL